MTLPLDGSCQGQYADGYIHDETEHGDVSPYTKKDNILNDILEKRPEAEHGPLVRFSCFYNDTRYDVDWVGLPNNARPVRWKRYENDYNGPLAGITRLVQLGFGYQYNDDTGKNIQEVQELI